MKKITAEIIQADGRVTPCELEVVENDQLESTPPRLEKAIRELRDLLTQKGYISTNKRGALKPPFNMCGKKY